MCFAWAVIQTRLCFASAKLQTSVCRYQSNSFLWQTNKFMNDAWTCHWFWLTIIITLKWSAVLQSNKVHLVTATAMTQMHFIEMNLFIYISVHCVFVFVFEISCIWLWLWMNLFFFQIIKWRSNINAFLCKTFLSIRV